MKEIIVKGETYKSLAELSRRCGLSVEIIRRRLKKGESPNNPYFFRERETKRLTIPILVFGKTFPSVNEACRILGFKRATILARVLKSGSSLKIIDGKYDYSRFFSPIRKEAFFRMKWPKIDTPPFGYILLTEFAKKYPALKRHHDKTIRVCIQKRRVLRHFCKCGRRIFVEEAFWKERQSWFSPKMLRIGLGLSYEEIRVLAERDNKGVRWYNAPIGRLKLYYLPQFLSRPHIDDIEKKYLN
jgi:lambda repressor-like predicted transcriptional regulator